MSLSDRIRPNCEAAPWVIKEVKKLELKLAQTQCGEMVANRDFRATLKSLTEAQLKLAKESAMLDWLESPYGRRFQAENRDVLIWRETIRAAMKENEN